MNKTRDTDDGVCGILDSSLREAIAAANSGNTITFSVTGTIILTSSQLIIDKDLTIEGPGSGDLAIRGNNSSRVFNTGGTVTIADVTIRDGRRDGFAGGGGISNGGRLTLTDSTVSNSTAHLGGGIYNDGTGTLTLDNSTISGNSATDGGGIWNGGTGTLTLNNSTVSGNTARGRGGGIYNMSDQGTLTITSSTISDNTANRTQGDYQGGGIYNGSGATLTLTNSTVSGNIAAFAGDWGGIFNFVDGTLTLTNSTVSDNRADRGGNGGGIRNFGTVTLTNTIIADNPSGGDCLGSITSLGFNLDSDGTCGLGGPGDVSNVDPLLGPLQDNGGPTFTHALLAGSPAIDAGDNEACPARDQRGYFGIAFPDCDIGAGYPRLPDSPEASRPRCSGHALGAAVSLETRQLGSGRAMA